VGTAILSRQRSSIELVISGHPAVASESVEPPLNTLSTIGSFVLGASMLPFLWNIARLEAEAGRAGIHIGRRPRSAAVARSRRGRSGTRRHTDMSTNDAQIETTGAHVYLIRVSVDEEAVEVTLRADPETVSRLSVEGAADERRIVDETTAYLIRRQRPDDLPPSLDLADVAAAHADWVDDMRAVLRDTEGGTTPACSLAISRIPRAIPGRTRRPGPRCGTRAASVPGRAT
jgi:hypothetical protein